VLAALLVALVTPELLVAELSELVEACDPVLPAACVTVADPPQATSPELSAAPAIRVSHLSMCAISFK
jgi:hypothetical protein